MPRGTRGNQEGRRRALRMLLRRRRTRTQDELVTALRDRGFDITQSSLSRDLMFLGARKVDGAYRIGSDADEQEDASACRCSSAHSRQRGGRCCSASHLGEVQRQPPPTTVLCRAGRRNYWRACGSLSTEFVVTPHSGLPVHDFGAGASCAKRHDGSCCGARTNRRRPLALRKPNNSGDLGRIASWTESSECLLASGWARPNSAVVARRDCCRHRCCRV